VTEQAPRGVRADVAEECRAVAALVEGVEDPAPPAQADSACAPPAASASRISAACHAAASTAPSAASQWHAN